MDAYNLGLDPKDNIIAKHIDFHPQLCVLAAGGIYKESGAVKFVCRRSQCGPDENMFEVSLEEVLPLNSVEALRFSPSGRFLAVAGCDSESYKLLVYHFRPSTAEIQGLEALPNLVPTSAAILPSDFSVLSDSEGNMLTHFRRFLIDTWPTSIVWSPDGTSIALAGGNGTITIIPVCTDNLFYNSVSDERPRDSNPQTVKVSSSQLLSISWSPCGSILTAQSLSSLFLILRTRTKNGHASYSLRSKVSSVDIKLLGEFLAFGRMTTPGEYERYFRDRFLRDDSGGIINLPQQPEELARAQMALLTQGSKSLFEHATSPSTVSLFLERGPEKAMNQERRSLRTMYAISLYRRGCAYSPDGSFLVATCGFLPVVPDNREDDILGYTFCSYVLSRQSLFLDRDKSMAPDIVLPGHRFPSVDVAFSPHLYELCPGIPNYSELPYSMIFAIVAGCDVHFYTTQDFSCIAVFKGESYQTAFLTCVSWSPHGDMLCAFGAFYQYLFLTLPPTCCKTYIGESERKYIQDIVKLSLASLQREQQLAKEQYKRLYYVYKTRLNSSAAESDVNHRYFAAPKKPVVKHSSYKDVMQLFLGASAASEEVNGSGRKLAMVPCFVLSRRLYDYHFVPPSPLFFTEADLDLELLKAELGADTEIQQQLNTPEAPRHTRSRKRLRDTSPPPLLSPAAVSAPGEEQPHGHVDRGALLDQMAHSKPATDEQGHRLPIYDKDYAQLAIQLVDIAKTSKAARRKIGGRRKKNPAVWRYRGWVSSSEEESSDYYSSDEP